MNRHFFLNTKITFGKYGPPEFDYTVKDLIDIGDFDYIEWMIDTFDCEDEIKLYMDSYIENVNSLEKADTSFLDEFDALPEPDFMKPLISFKKT